MQTVVGLYDHFEDAQQTVQALREAGFESNRISMIASDSEGRYSRYLQGDESKKQDMSDKAATGAGIGAVLGGLGGLLVGLGALAIPGIGPVIAAGPIVSTLAGAGVGAVAGGVVGGLVDMGIPEEHARAYAEGVRRGGTLVTLQTDANRAGEAESIMNRFHPVDIQDRSSQWQGSNAEQMPSNRAGMPSQAIPVTGDQTEGEDLDVDERQVSGEIPVTGSDVSIPVVEEDLRVGKREVDTGGVQIESHMVEEPVEEDINLRHEHVNVERRPVDRPATEEDFDAFQEGTIEMRETTEEPVVEKRSRVVEEVHVNKDVDEENRKIRDTVRHTDVDVHQVGSSVDWDRYDQQYRNDFQTRYGSSGFSYADYQPAYRMGYDLANNPQYRGYDWIRMEPIARQQWTRQGSVSAWEDVKDSIRYAWESVMNRSNR